MTIEVWSKGLLRKAGNIFVIRTFMPFPLKETNAFLAEGPRGWTVVDSGVNTPENRAIWTSVLGELGIGFRQIKAIYITHHHHDHIGLAGWLQQQSEAPVYMSSPDLKTFQNLIMSGEYEERIRKNCTRAGWPAALTHELALDIAAIDPLIRPYPHLSPWTEKDILWGGYNYQVRTVPGHSEGHLVFLSEESGLLFPGDNVVGHTILHMTDWPHDEMSSPLSQYLGALDELLKYRLNNCLPGHGKAFTNLEERVRSIKSHHNKRKLLVYEGLKNQPSTAWEIARGVFKDNRYIHIKRLFLAETLAYLQVLEEEGLAVSALTGSRCLFMKKDR